MLPPGSNELRRTYSGRQTPWDPPLYKGMGIRPMRPQLSCVESNRLALSLGARLARHVDPLRTRILHHMVMQRDDPTRPRVLRAGALQGADLIGGDQSQRVGEGEMRVGVRVEQDDAEPVVALGRQHHREYVRPEVRQLLRPYRLAGIGELGHRTEVRRQRLRERLAETAARAIDHMHAVALNHAYRRQHP